MRTLENQFEYWDSVSSSKIFTHPVDIDRFHSVVSQKANILDFGCGYGRTCAELYHLGFHNIVGVDHIAMFYCGIRVDHFKDFKFSWDWNITRQRKRIARALGFLNIRGKWI